MTKQTHFSVPLILFLLFLSTFAVSTYADSSVSNSTNTTVASPSPSFTQTVIINTPSSLSSVPSNSSNLPVFNPASTNDDWQYGESMVPSYSTYDSVEMPTGGLIINTPPTGDMWWYWVSSTTQSPYNDFAQEGFVYNGNSGSECVISCGTPIPAHSWALFVTITVGGTYYGDAILPNQLQSGWSATDHIYFSIAVYPEWGEFSFLFTDTTINKQLADAYCFFGIGGQFTGNVGGLAEGGHNTSNFGNIYVSQSTLWAQSISTGKRVTGNVDASGTHNADGTSDAPQLETIFVYSSPYGEFLNGYNDGQGGQHYILGTQIFSGSYTFNNEYLPPHECTS